MNSVHDKDISTLEDEFGDLLIDLYSDEGFQTPTADIEESENGKKFLDLLNNLDSKFLPYHTITQFVYDPEKDREISHFAMIIYTTIKNKENIDYETKDKALKIRQHLLLAEQQKNSLYREQEDEINDINNFIKQTNNEVKNSRKKLRKNQKIYDNMLSQYISILGIFAAILMTAFGGIQAFSSIYKNNSFSLKDSLLIACIGFIGILLLIFILLNGIAKLTDKNIDSNEGRWFNRHPTLINSFILLSTIIIFILVSNIAGIPSILTDNNWLWLLVILYPVIMFFFFNRKSK